MRGSCHYVFNCSNEITHSLGWTEHNYINWNSRINEYNFDFLNYLLSWNFDFFFKYCASLCMSPSEWGLHFVKKFALLHNLQFVMYVYNILLFLLVILLCMTDSLTDWLSCLASLTLSQLLSLFNSHLCPVGQIHFLVLLHSTPLIHGRLTPNDIDRFFPFSFFFALYFKQFTKTYFKT